MSIPTIKVHTTPETAPGATWGCEKYAVFRIEIDGRAVGPLLKEKDAHKVALWLEDAWPELEVKG